MVKISVVHPSENESYSRRLVFITLKAFAGRVKGFWDRYVHPQACGLTMLSNVYQEALYGQDQSELFTVSHSQAEGLRSSRQKKSPGTVVLQPRLALLSWCLPTL